MYQVTICTILPYEKIVSTWDAFDQLSPNSMGIIMPENSPKIATGGTRTHITPVMNQKYDINGSFWREMKARQTGDNGDKKIRYTEIIAFRPTSNNASAAGPKKIIENNS